MVSTIPTQQFPCLAGQRIVLRPFDERHITAEYIGWLSDPVLMQYSNQRFRHHDRETSLDYLQTFRGTGNLFLAIHAGHAFVGTMTAYRVLQHDTADMGLLVGAGYQGRGFGADAWLTLMQHLLATGVRKVTGGTLCCNRGMVRIMEASGMQPDGTRAGQELVYGQPQDVLYFARFNS